MSRRLIDDLTISSKGVIINEALKRSRERKKDRPSHRNVTDLLSTWGGISLTNSRFQSPASAGFFVADKMSGLGRKADITIGYVKNFLNGDFRPKVDIGRTKKNPATMGGAFG